MSRLIEHEQPFWLSAWESGVHGVGWKGARGRHNKQLCENTQSWDNLQHKEHLDLYPSDFWIKQLILHNYQIMISI